MTFTEPWPDGFEDLFRVTDTIKVLKIFFEPEEITIQFLKYCRYLTQDMAVKKAEDQQADQSVEVRVTPSQQYPSVITSSNHLGAGVIQGANIVNSTVNNLVIKSKGESMNDQVKTDIRDMAAEQRRQGETVEELAVDLVNEQQILGETLNTLQTEQRDIAASSWPGFNGS